jgi:hypothetical protein
VCIGESGRSRAVSAAMVDAEWLLLRVKESNAICKRGYRTMVKIHNESGRLGVKSPLNRIGRIFLAPMDSQHSPKEEATGKISG